MMDESTQTGEEATALSPLATRKPYELPALLELAALRDVTLTEWTSKGRRDGRKNRGTGRGGMNGQSRESTS